MMEFKEINYEPRFNLELSLQESIDLWGIANKALNDGDDKAQTLVDALHWFAERSNSYT